MTAAPSLHLAFDMMAIVYKSLLDTYIKCYKLTLCSSDRASLIICAVLCSANAV